MSLDKTACAVHNFVFPDTTISTEFRELLLPGTADLWLSLIHGWHLRYCLLLGSTNRNLTSLILLTGQREKADSSVVEMPLSSRTNAGQGVDPDQERRRPGFPASVVDELEAVSTYTGISEKPRSSKFLQLKCVKLLLSNGALQ